MSRSNRSIFLALPLAILLPAVHSRTCLAQQPGANTAGQDSSGFGAGGHRDQDTTMTNGVLHGSVYDEQGTLRQEETDTYLPSDTRQKTEKSLLDFDLKGHLTLSADYKYDLHGGLNSTDFIHYGLHGERTWEEITNYQPGGYEIKDWNLGIHSWYTDFNPYKFPKPPANGAPPPISPLPANVNVGVLFPRDYHPGDNIIGSLHLASYADNFKVVPGFSEFDFPIQLYHLPDGTPEWSSLEIGVKGDGYYPVGANGTFSLHIPMNWKGPLELQALQPDPLAGVGPSSAGIDIGNPVAAPTLPSHDSPGLIDEWMQYFTANHLINLWNEAYDREVELDEAYDNPNYSNEEIADLEYDLDDCYGEIDYVASLLPTKVVVDLARDLAHDADDYTAWLSQQPNLTADDKDDLDDSSGWASFLHDEASHASFIATWGSTPAEQPFWTSPVLMQSKLGAIRGSFDDPLSFHLGIDSKPIAPIAATPTEYYFLPSTDLTAGQHEYDFNTPVIAEMSLPFFYMKLTMSADQLALHKGQSTTYHVRLDGVNGLPPGAWGAPFYPTDLLSPPAGGGNSARTGTVTLEVTNQSRDTISMQDQFRTLDATNFAPLGSFQLDGGVHAVKDGDFSIYGEAQAKLDPVVGLGPGPSAPPPTYGPGGSAWMPGLNWSYDPSWAKSSPLLTTCSTEAAAGAPPCMDRQMKSIYDQATDSRSPIEVQEQDHPDLTKLPQAAKRVEDAQHKVKEARENAYRKARAVGDAWSDGLKNAPAPAPSDWEQSVMKLNKAEAARTAAREKYEKTPGVDTAQGLATAEKDVADALRDKQAADQKLIDSFKPDDRKRYDDARAASDKAWKEVDAAEQEEREAREALEKLRQAALNH